MAIEIHYTEVKLSSSAELDKVLTFTKLVTRCLVNQIFCKKPHSQTISLMNTWTKNQLQGNLIKKFQKI